MLKNVASQVIVIGESMEDAMIDTIPTDVALKLCEGIRKQNQGRWYSFYGIWCMMCNKISKGDIMKLCFHGRPDNRGCSQVNNRYDKRKPSSS